MRALPATISACLALLFLLSLPLPLRALTPCLLVLLCNYGCTDGYCAQEGNPLHRPPSLRIRQTSMHSLHAACIHVDGLSGSVEMTDNLCLRPRGELDYSQAAPSC